jgi:hypothetical protein
MTLIRGERLVPMEFLKRKRLKTRRGTDTTTIAQQRERSWKSIWDLGNHKL